MPENYSPFPEIVGELARLSRNRATGTLFVATDANRGAQVMLDKGEIVYLSYANKRGIEALALIPGIAAGRYRFQDSRPPSSRMDLPATAAILALMERGGGPAVAPAAASHAGPDPETPGLTQHQRNILQDCLAEFVGPIAAIVCEDQLDRAHDLGSAIDALSAEISSPELTREFQALALKRLR